METVDLAILSQKLRQLRERERQRAQLDGPELDDHPFELREPLDAESLTAFENREDVSLPADYAAFLTQLGNGGAGPPHYGLYSLADAESESCKTIYRLNDPFTPPGSTDDYVDLEAPGMLTIGYEGCNFFVGLVVSGPEAGSVWSYVEVRPGWVPLSDRSRPLVGPDGDPFVFEGDYGAWYDARLLPQNRGLRLSFSRYYEQWLDGYLQPEPASGTA